MKRLLTLLVCLMVCLSAFAEKVTFEAIAPNMVAVGDVFRVEYSLNANPDDFTPPQFKGIDVIAGPTTSKGQSISIVNGNMTQTINFTYTYVVQVMSAGKATIPSATVVVDGKQYTSQPLVIEVVAEDNQNSQSNRQQSAAQSEHRTSPGNMSASDVLVKAQVSKTNVYKGEPIHLIFTLYTRVPISGVESSKQPAFNGFWNQSLDTEHYKWQRTTLDGKVYDSRIIGDYLLYPQRTGQIHIEQLSMTVILQYVRQQRHSQGLFDDFFNGGSIVENIPRTISTQPLAINVRELPEGAPASFNGAVGDFQLNSDISSLSLVANSSATYTLKISGTGNLPLIQAPKISLPASMEQYNIKTTESLRSTAEGISGYRSFEYPFIPRSEGEYNIPKVEFTYFNPKTVRYVTLTTPDYLLKISADSTGVGIGGGGMLSGLNREDLKILEQDIRFIKLGSHKLSSADRFYITTWAFYVYILIIINIAILAYLYIKRTKAQLSNKAFVRNKKANRVALQRLKAAENYMQQNNQRLFYEEMLKALWGYMSDKLNIPISNLTKDNIRESISRRGIAIEQANHFIDIITECEYAQYSPSASVQMSEVYQKAVNILSKFESTIKKAEL